MVCSPVTTLHVLPLSAMYPAWKRPPPLNEDRQTNSEELAFLPPTTEF